MWTIFIRVAHSKCLIDVVLKFRMLKLDMSGQYLRYLNKTDCLARRDQAPFSLLKFSLLSFSLIGERISQQAIAQLRYTYELKSLSEKTRKSNHLLMSV